MPCQGTRVALVDDRRASVRQSIHACVSVNAVSIPGLFHRKTLNLGLSEEKSRQLSCSRTSKEGRTSLDPCIEQIYARRRILLGVVPGRLPILFNAAQPLAHKSCQSRPVNAAAWGCTDSIRLNDPAGLLKALSMREDASARERVKESRYEPEMLLYAPFFPRCVWNVLEWVLDWLARELEMVCAINGTPPVSSE